MIIEVIVSPSGETKIETKGFTGTTCREASRFLEQSLGQQLADQPTAESYTTQTTENHQHHQSSGGS